MKSLKLVCVILSALFAAMGAIHAAENRQLVFADDFDGRTVPGKEYNFAKAGADAFPIVDGVLMGRQTRDDHGAVIRKNIAFDDIDIEVDFRFNGGSRFNFVIDDANEKSVHAGHICRVSISPKKMTVSDDKTGGMNLKVRALRQTKNLPADQKAALAKIMKATQAPGAVNMKKGEWQHLRVRISGDLMEAHLNGKVVSSLRSPGIAHPTKTKFGFTVNGATIDFDNLKVYKPKK